MIEENDTFLQGLSYVMFCSFGVYLYGCLQEQETNYLRSTAWKPRF
jgi:hypothetical protein